MKFYIGIDLGTTNSAICVYDGMETKIYKSPEQADVTPSAIYVDKRGHRFYGRKAVSLAGGNSGSYASLFKRYLGTNKVFDLGEAGNGKVTPVECCAELLHHLYGYLPEEIRNSPDTVTVITVPAAFNQMKKDATLEAARLAGIGKVALIQEPVAAVMSVLKRDPGEKRFLVYDLGGGTFDISAAEHKGGQVNLLSQGGKEMCGGRDWDLWIYENKILPWLSDHFDLPETFDKEEEYAIFRRRAILSAEQAKIELSQSETAFIQMNEEEACCTDRQGKELYLDILLARQDLSDLLEELAEVTCDVAKQVMEQAGILPGDISQMIFVGGPTMYRPLRERVCEILDIPAGLEVNPMTAVAEGASIYAESVDFGSELHRRKASFAKQVLSDSVRLHYESRTAAEEGQIALLCKDGEKYTAEISSVPEDRYSESVAFCGNTIIKVPLGEPGEHVFRIVVFDDHGFPLKLSEDRVTITRTLATVQSIPASHSIAAKALDRPDGKAVPVFLIRQNDPLPYTGDVTFLAGQRLPAGSEESLVFTLWEGEIEEPVDDNLYIGTYRIPGNSFTSGVIAAGDEIICHYTVNESGNLHLGVEIPSVGLKTEEKNFYSRTEGQTDLQDTAVLLREINNLLQRCYELSEIFSDTSLYRMRKDLQRARIIAQKSEDPEQLQWAFSKIVDARRELAYIRKRHLKDVRQIDLDKALQRFSGCEKEATLSEKAKVKNLAETAQLSISHNSSDFETVIQEIHNITGRVLWRNDWVVEAYFRAFSGDPSACKDQEKFAELKQKGEKSIKKGNYDQLRMIVNELAVLRTEKAPAIDTEQMLEDVNIVKY